MNYYFLAASLPMLSLDEAPEFGVTDFLELCREHLSEGHMAVLSRITANDIERRDDNAFVREWRNRDTQLRNAIVKERAARKDCDPEEYLREQSGYDSDIARAVSDAFGKADPRETELALDRLRWRIIDNAQGYDPFSARAIFGYVLKLRIAERWARMNDKEGRAQVEAIVEPSSKFDLSPAVTKP